MTFAVKRVRDGSFHFLREIDVSPGAVEWAALLNLECLYMILNAWVL